MNGYPDPQMYAYNNLQTAQYVQYDPETQAKMQGLQQIYSNYMAIMNINPGAKFVRQAKKEKKVEAQKQQFLKSRKTSFNIISNAQSFKMLDFRKIDSRFKIMNLFLGLQKDIKVNENIVKYAHLPVVKDDFKKAEIEEFSPSPIKNHKPRRNTFK